MIMVALCICTYDVQVQYVFNQSGMLILQEFILLPAIKVEKKSMSGHINRLRIVVHCSDF